MWTFFHVVWWAFEFWTMNSPECGLQLLIKWHFIWRSSHSSEILTNFFVWIHVFTHLHFNVLIPQWIFLAIVTVSKYCWLWFVFLGTLLFFGFFFFCTLRYFGGVVYMDKWSYLNSQTYVTLEWNSMLWNRTLYLWSLHRFGFFFFMMGQSN